jgi:magnesium chelatase family protein
MLARVNACAVIGLDGVIVDVEVDITTKVKPPMIIVGLPDVSVLVSQNIEMSSSTKVY